MEILGTLFLIWLLHAAIGATLSAPILAFGRTRAGWALWQLLALVVPFCLWTVLILSPASTGRKSLANLGEPIYISFAMPVLALIRMALGARLSERTCAVIVLATLCVLAASTFFLVPLLPE